MSRTDNTMPWRIQRQDRPEWTHWLHLGGSYAGVGKAARYAEKAARQRVRQALARGEQPEPTRHRGDMKWRWW